MFSWTDAALRLLAQGAPTAMVTILCVEGSTPREAGTRMIVTLSGVLGTIGGGALEQVAIDQARALLDQPAGVWRVQDYPLGPLLGQCCGGRVRLLLEHLDRAATDWILRAHAHLVAGDSFVVSTRFEPDRLERCLGVQGHSASARGPMPQVSDVLMECFADQTPRVLLFGYGHVGAAVRRIVSSLPFRLEVYDTRSGLHPEDPVEPVAEAEAEALSEAARQDDLMLVMTHDHALDYRLVLAGLRGEADFVGLIGSATKRARFLRRLQAEGLGARQLERLCSPIGAPGISGKQPEIIAVAVAAQLLALRSKRLAPAVTAPAGCPASACLAGRSAAS